MIYNLFWGNIVFTHIFVEDCTTLVLGEIEEFCFINLHQLFNIEFHNSYHNKKSLGISTEGWTFITWNPFEFLGGYRAGVSGLGLTDFAKLA